MNIHRAPLQGRVADEALFVLSKWEREGVKDLSLGL